MATILHPDIGRVWVPNTSISFRGQTVKVKPTNFVVTTLRRPRWSIEGLFKLPHVQHPFPSARAVLQELLAPFIREIDPKKFLSEVIWASVMHNERVQDGGDHNVNRTFGTVGDSNAVGSIVAVADTSMTVLNTHQSINSTSQGVTTSEFTTIGLSRATGTVQNYTAPASLNATYSVDVYKSFSVSGSGTATGAALFDQITVAGSRMLCEDNFSSSAVVESGDTLNVTWTYNN